MLKSGIPVEEILRTAGWSNTTTFRKFYNSQMGDRLKLLSIYFDLCVDATGAVCYQLGLLCADLHAVANWITLNFASSFAVLPALSLQMSVTSP